MNAIHQFASAILPVVTFAGPNQAALGTGFLIQDKGKVFVVASEHVSQTEGSNSLLSIQTSVEQHYEQHISHFGFRQRLRRSSPTVIRYSSVLLMTMNDRFAQIVSHWIAPSSETVRRRSKVMKCHS